MEKLKLTRLQINDFLAIQSADMDLTKPVHVIAGDNNQGKSSARDAITMALRGTAPARGYDKKNQAPKMIRRGAKSFNILLDTANGCYQRTDKRGTKCPIDDLVAEIACMPQAVLGMTPKTRQKVFSAVMAHAGTGDKIEEYLSANNGFGPEVFDICRTGDLDAAQEWAVEQRRIAKRTIKDLDAQCDIAPPDIVDIGEKTFDLTKQDNTYPATVNAQLTKREMERDALIANDLSDEDAESLQQGIDKLKQDRDALPTTDDLTAKLEKAREEFIQLSDARNAGDRKIGQYEAELKALNSKSKRLSDTDGPCPICGTKLTAQQKAGMLEQMGFDIKKVESDKAKAEISNTQTSMDCQAKSDELQEIKKSIADADDTVRQYNDDIDALTVKCENIANNQNTEKIAEKKQSIVNLQALLTASTAYFQHKALADDIQKRRNAANLTIEQMDKLDGLLKPDGELRQIANGDMDALKFDEKLQSLWGMDGLKLEADGMITFHGDPIEAASDSEKYRAGVLLAELLCRSLNVGLMIIDGIDILSLRNRKALFTRMPVWMQDHATIMLIMTAPANMSVPRESWLQGWRVEKGIVTPMTQTQPRKEATNGTGN